VIDGLREECIVLMVDVDGGQRSSASKDEKLEKEQFTIAILAITFFTSNTTLQQHDHNLACSICAFLSLQPSIHLSQPPNLLAVSSALPRFHSPIFACFTFPPLFLQSSHRNRNG
jgi:hypothetical protein